MLVSGEKGRGSRLKRTSRGSVRAAAPSRDPASPRRGAGSTLSRTSVSSRPAAGSREPRTVLALVVLAVLAGLDRLPPGAVLPVPRDRRRETLVEVLRRLPAEPAKLRAVERI